MDLAVNCLNLISEQLDKVNDDIFNQGDDGFRQTQNIMDSVVADKDKNLDTILDQQAIIKTLIDRDERVKILKRLINEDNKIIEDLRRSCSKISLSMLKYRQDQREEHSKELERFQLQQLKNITDDHHRHQRILEQRHHELAGLKAEYEREENGRKSYLASTEKALERQIEQRKYMMGDVGLTDEIQNPNHVELVSVDEYAPYGTSNDPRPGPVAGTSRGRGRGRGRKTQSTNK